MPPVPIPLQVLQEMQDQRVFPNHTVYLGLLEALGMKDHHQHIPAVLTRIRNKKWLLTGGAEDLCVCVWWECVCVVGVWVWCVCVCVCVVYGMYVVCGVCVVCE